MDKSTRLGDLDIDDFLGSFYKARLANSLLNTAQAKFFPTDEQLLDTKLKRLDVVTKKTMLGMPLNDDDYESSVNEDKPFLQRNMGLMAVGAASVLKRPKPLPSLQAFEKPAQMNYAGNPKLSDLPGVFKYFKPTKPKPKLNVNVGELYGWVRRGVLRR